jgi:hypothetical protein
LVGLTRACGPQQAAQQDSVDATSEALFAVDQDDGHALVVLLAQRGIRVDVDALWAQSMVAQHLRGVIAEMASDARVENHFHWRRSQ